MGEEASVETIPGGRVLQMKVKTFTIDTKGNRWTWNCGWWLVDKNGKPKRTQRKPLGHVEFARNITILDPSDKKQREVLHGMDKPGRFWRRRVNRELMHHDLFGSCYVLASDGCHAVIEVLGEHKYVCFENLSEPIGVPLAPRAKATPKAKETTAKKVKVNQLLAKYGLPS